jgi:hypothetical protein
MSETIDFKFNQPVLVTLAFAEGRNVPSKFPGSTRTMRTTKDARVFFCDPQLEAKIAALSPAPGVQVEITKVEREGARKGFDWKVSRVGEQQDGTYKIPKADPASTSPGLTESASVTEQASHQSELTNAQQSITAMPVRKGPTEAETHCYRLVDLTAATMQYAKERHGGLVREDDARSIAITVYIQSAKMGMIRRRKAG